MYYQAQVRNLAQEAELERQLISVQYLENKVQSENQEKSRYRKGLGLSRREKDKQTALYLARSRIQSELDASTVRSNEILNRSRIEAALQNRQRNQELKASISKSLLEEQSLYAAELQAERQLYLQKSREKDLNYLRQQGLKDDIYRRILQEQKEAVLNKLRSEEIRRQVQEQQLRRQLKLRYDLLAGRYSYY